MYPFTRVTTSSSASAVVVAGRIKYWNIDILKSDKILWYWSFEIWSNICLSESCKLPPIWEKRECVQKMRGKTLVQLLVVSEPGWWECCLNCLTIWPLVDLNMWSNIKRSSGTVETEEASALFYCFPSFHRCTIVICSCSRLSYCHAIKSFPTLTWPRSTHVESVKGKRCRQFSQTHLLNNAFLLHHQWRN